MKPRIILRNLRYFVKPRDLETSWSSGDTIIREFFRSARADFALGRYSRRGFLPGIVTRASGPEPGCGQVHLTTVSQHPLSTCRGIN